MEPTNLAATFVLSTCVLLAVPAVAPVASAREIETPLVLGHDTLHRASQDMRRVLSKLDELGARPIGSRSVEATRAQPTPADAVAAILTESGQDPARLRQAMDIEAEGMAFPTGDGLMQPIRIYRPRGVGAGALPVILYFHGGGWVIGGIDDYEASAMALARETGAVVASVGYRRAPEHKFPAAHEDAIAAYEWTLANAGRFGGDPDAVAVAGESAGGNLALHVAVAARDRNLPPPEHMLLIYPVASTELDTPSYQDNADAKPLDRAAMKWFLERAVTEPADLGDPRLDVVNRADLSGLPPATVITAEIDPLRSEGKVLADRLRAFGNEAQHQDFPGVTHEFFGMAPVLPAAKEAQRFAATRLKEALSTSSAEAPP